jgi:hypothetical protein
MSYYYELSGKAKEMTVLYHQGLVDIEQKAFKYAKEKFNSEGISYGNWGDLVGFKTTSDIPKFMKPHKQNKDIMIPSSKSKEGKQVIAEMSKFKKTTIDNNLLKYLDIGDMTFGEPAPKHGVYTSFTNTISFNNKAFLVYGKLFEHPDVKEIPKGTLEKEIDEENERRRKK